MTGSGARAPRVSAVIVAALSHDGYPARLGLGAVGTSRSKSISSLMGAVCPIPRHRVA
jgi:hypothetical protein